MRALALAGITAALLVLAGVPGDAQAQTRKPLLVEGRTTIYQRVLAKDEAQMHDMAGGEPTGTITPFQPLYVYADQGDGWIEVGRSLLRGPEGWMLSEDTVPWRQNIVVSFSNPAARQRQLMFDKKETLLGVVEHESPIGSARNLRNQVREQGAAPGVVTIEPEAAVPLEQNFYLLPILDWEQYTHTATWNENMRLLRLASLPLREAAEQEVVEAEVAAGVVFVIDTTSSMEPYIDETRNAVVQLVQELQGSPAGEFIRFGAVGFRDSREAALEVDPARDIEYRTRVFLDIAADQGPDQVRQSLEQIVEAEASTIGFDEDSIAGIIEAINLPGWDDQGIDGGPIQQRYVIVISDASPKPPRHENALYELVPSAVLQRARDKDITLVAVHIKTPDGQLNHRVAEAAYKEMTRLPTTGRSFYEAVDLTAADVDARAAFRPVIDALVQTFSSDYAAVTDELRQAQGERELTVAEEASLAMRLAWLGRQANVSAPDVIEAWTLDYSLEDPTLPALDVRLLITKNELSTMRDILKEIVTAGEISRAGGDFFAFLRGAFARMAADQGQLVNTDFETLDEAVGEFLADLPYQSEIMGITPDEWASMGSMRTTILDRVTSAMTQFEFYHDNPAYWTELYEGQDPGEYVFAMPLQDLP